MQVRTIMGSFISIIRRVFGLLLASDHCHGCVVRQGAYSDPFEFHWCISQDDKDKVSKCYVGRGFYIRPTNDTDTPWLDSARLCHKRLTFSKSLRSKRPAGICVTSLTMLPTRSCIQRYPPLFFLHSKLVFEQGNQKRSNLCGIRKTKHFYLLILNGTREMRRACWSGDMRR